MVPTDEHTEMNYRPKPEYLYGHFEPSGKDIYFCPNDGGRSLVAIYGTEEKAALSAIVLNAAVAYIPKRCSDGGVG
jgi:hypothetical protein